MKTFIAALIATAVVSKREEKRYQEMRTKNHITDLCPRAPGCKGPSCYIHKPRCMRKTNGCYEAWKKTVSKEGCGSDMFVDFDSKGFEYEGME